MTYDTHDMDPLTLFCRRCGMGKVDFVQTRPPYRCVWPPPGLEEVIGDDPGPAPPERGLIDDIVDQVYRDIIRRGKP